MRIMWKTTQTEDFADKTLQAVSFDLAAKNSDNYETQARRSRAHRLSGVKRVDACGQYCAERAEVWSRDIPTDFPLEGHTKFDKRVREKPWGQSLVVSGFSPREEVHREAEDRNLFSECSRGGGHGYD